MLTGDTPHTNPYRTRPGKSSRPLLPLLFACLLAGLVAVLFVAGCGTLGIGRGSAPTVSAPTDAAPAADSLAAEAEADDDASEAEDSGAWADSLAAPVVPGERAAWLAAHPGIRELEELFRKAITLTARNMFDPAEDLLGELKAKVDSSSATPADSIATAYRASLSHRLTLLAALLAEERVVLGRQAPPDSVLEAVYADLRGLVFPDTLAPISPEARTAIQRELLDIDNPLVQQWLDYFTGPGRSFFARWLDRKAGTDSLMVGILKDAGLPPELFYLSVIESGLSPRARSRVGAVGYWQFMPGTAKHFDLRRDWWVDERRDLEMSTRAAATYLSQLYNYFQNWPLVLAAYNAGEGRVDRIIKRAGHSDFWRLPLPDQTRNHIPKFIAAARIFANPAAYGFDPPATPPLRYDVVKVDSPTDIDVIARCAGTDREQVQALNPALLRGVSPPDARSYAIRVPAGLGEQCQLALARIPADQRITWRSHPVKKGDTLGGIARRYGVSVALLKQTNHMGRSNMIHPGDRLLIPVPGFSPPAVVAEKSGRDSVYGSGTEMAASGADPVPKSAASAAQVAATPKPSRDQARSGGYTPPDGYQKVSYSVRPGDTLFAIAKKLGVTLDHLRQVNRLTRRALLRPGQTLFAWLPASSARAGTNAG